MIAISSIGVVGSIPLLLLYDLASAFPSVVRTWLLCILTAMRIWTSHSGGSSNLYKGAKLMLLLIAYLNIFSVLFLRFCKDPSHGTLLILVIDHSPLSFQQYL